MSGYIPIFAEGVIDSEGEPAGRVTAEGLAKNAALVLAGATYPPTGTAVIKGFTVITCDGLNDITITPPDGTPIAFALAAAFIGQTIPIQLESITIPTATELLVYI